MRVLRYLPILLLAAGLAVALAVALAARASAGQGDVRTITGSVRYAGKPPARKPLDTRSEKACADRKLLDESVVVSPDGTLRDVHVRIAIGAAGKHAAPARPVVMRQDGCRYQPHVVGVVEGQELWIENDDAFMHNIHARLDGDTWFNRSQPRGAPAIKNRDLGKAGEVLELRCDVHPWMRAHVVVTDHPYFAVTGDDGGFTLANVPAGRTFTIEAWHPTLGKKTRTARAGDTVEFVFP
jgi:plastocyanin